MTWRHGPPFRIVGRTPSAVSAGVVEGLLDEGWRDTFLVMPGERDAQFPRRILSRRSLCAEPGAPG
jgi:hypothetical protein